MCTPIEAMKRHITFENTVQTILPRNLWIGSMNRIISQSMPKTTAIAATAFKGPELSSVVKLVTIAPGPASRGQAKGTQPIS